MTNNPPKPKFRPSNEIDLQTLTIVPHISGDEVADDIINSFREFEKDSNGDFIVTESGDMFIKKDYWTKNKLLTSDLILGNLSKEELSAIRKRLFLISAISTYLPKEFNKSSSLLVTDVFGITLTSQSKNGFKSRLINTQIQHQTIKDETPEKRGWLGFGKKKNEG